MTVHAQIDAWKQWQTDRGQVFVGARRRLVQSKPAKSVVFFLSATDTALTEQEDALLDKMIAAMGLGVEVTVAKLRGSAQVDSASVLITLGSSAARELCGAEINFPDLCGHWQTSDTLRGVAILPTYHPRDLLQTPALKRDAWNHLKMVIASLNSESRSVSHV